MVLAAAFFLGLEVDLVDLAATLARPVRGVARAEGAEAVRAGIGSEWTSAEGACSGLRKRRGLRDEAR